MIDARYNSSSMKCNISRGGAVYIPDLELIINVPAGIQAPGRAK